VLHLWDKLRAHIRRGAAAYLVLAVALVPSGVAYYRVQQNVAARDKARFEDRTEAAVEALQESLNQYAAAVRAVGGLFEASEMVRPQEWERFAFALDIEKRHPGLRSIGYAPIVPASEVSAFSARAAAWIGTNLVVHEFAGADVAVPTVYLKQFGNAQGRVLGWDAMADPKRRAALTRVLREGRPMLTDAQLFASDREPVIGFIAYQPVFGFGTNKNEIAGVVFSSFVPQRVLTGLTKKQLDPGLSVQILDDDGSGNPLASNAMLPPAPQFSATNHVLLFGQPFVVRVASLPAFEAQSEKHLPRLALSGGILFSLMLFGIAWTQVNARSAAENLNKRLLTSEEQLLRSNRELERRVDDLKKTEALLAHERDLLRTLLDHSPDRIYFKDRESRFIKCGKAVVGWLGLKTGSDPVGKTDFDFFAEEHARAAYDVEQQILRTGEPVIGIVEREIWHDGHESWALTSKMPLRDKYGNIIGTFGTSKDVTALKRAELELEKEKELLAVTLRSIGDGVITTDMNGHIVLFNKVAEHLTGWIQADAIGKPLRDVFRTMTSERRDTDTELVRRALSHGEIVAQERGSILARDNSERHIAESVAPIVDHDGKTIGAVLVFRDITEKLKTEEELLRASKLESIGVLAGGIAHDFNNILTVILGNISLARMFTDTLPPQVGNVLGEAEKASLRARDLTQRLLTFAKGGAPIKKAIVVGPLLRDCARSALQGSNVNYQFFISEDLWPVHADEGQLAQVLHNLIQNARQAVGDKPAIDIHASNHEIARDPLLFIEPGRYVRISIRDHGAGLQPEQLSKIFDPYFSSKKQGSGLELATAYSIVRKHGGQIRVESISGEGTVFHIYLPASDTTAPAPAAIPPKSIRAAQGRILVMDDEPAIRELAAILLKRIGYTATVAADGIEAISVYEAARKAGEPFAAVIMDLTIPNGMGGVETIRKLRAIDPSVRAIVCSGYSNDPVMANHREYGFMGVVPKPYSAEDLALALGELLGAPTLQRDPADVCV
jgi:PAS domain S-box-containing protein